MLVLCEWIHVTVDAHGQVIEHCRRENVVMVQAPGLAGDGLELKAFQNVRLIGKAGYRFRRTFPSRCCG